MRRCGNRGCNSCTHDLVHRGRYALFPGTTKPTPVTFIHPSNGHISNMGAEAQMHPTFSHKNFDRKIRPSGLSLRKGYGELRPELGESLARSHLQVRQNRKERGSLVNVMADSAAASEMATMSKRTYV